MSVKRVPSLDRPRRTRVYALSLPSESDVYTGQRDVVHFLRNVRFEFCGINPGLYSAATGHHFARPGNRFWPALHLAGFTPRVLAPPEQRRLLDLKLGVTNLVNRATAKAAEVDRTELRAGLRELEVKVAALAPAWVAVLGVGAYRTAFARPRATVGPQPSGLAGARIWVLPNPSGLNAHYQLEDLAAAYAELRRAAL